MPENFFAKNIGFLRKNNRIKQRELQDRLGFVKNTWSNWENAKSQPSIENILIIARFFDINIDDLLTVNLEERQLNSKNGTKIENNDHFNEKENNGSTVQEGTVSYRKTRKTNSLWANADQPLLNSAVFKTIPIVDLVVAMRAGMQEEEPLKPVGYINVSQSMIGTGYHLAIRNQGLNMEPVLPDASLLIIRLLERSGWANMQEDELYLITDTQGRSYVKTIKKTAHEDVILLISEHSDKTAYPDISMTMDQIRNIWQLDGAYIMRFHKVYNQYYERLRDMEDEIDEIKRHLKLSSDKKTD